MCLSHIIRGDLMSKYQTDFGLNTVPCTCFDEEDFYCGTEINEFLEQVRPRSETNERKQLGGLKSILTPTKLGIGRLNVVNGVKIILNRPLLIRYQTSC